MKHFVPYFFLLLIVSTVSCRGSDRALNQSTASNAEQMRGLSKRLTPFDTKKDLNYPIANTQVTAYPGDTLIHIMKGGWTRTYSPSRTIVRRAFNFRKAEDIKENTRWYPTWIYSSSDAEHALVLTSSSFYEGKIGVMVDDNGSTVTSKPLIAKNGERWSMGSQPNLFGAEAMTKTGPGPHERYFASHGGFEEGDTLILNVIIPSGTLGRESQQQIKYNLSESNTIYFRNIIMHVSDYNKSGEIVYSIKHRE